jgi:hypothetical protein
MRLLIIILLFSLNANAQIVRCNSFYKPNAFSFLLDLYPSARFGFSLRKLRSTYNGNCLRVRRSSDNTEQDIGFVNNYLDTTSMKTFVGANNGFVVTWYDQSGNALNVTQGTAANQPRIILSGVIDKQNSKPTIYFNGSAYYLRTATITNATYSISDGNWASFGVGSVSLATGVKALASSDNSLGSRLPQFIRINLLAVETISFNGATAYTDGNGNISLSTLYLFSSFKYPSFTEIYTNNSSNGATSSNTQTTNTTYVLTIGASSNATVSAYYNGYISEYIQYPTNQLTNRTSINTLINNFYSIY